MRNKIPPPIVTLFFGLCIYFSQEYFPESNLEFLTILSYIFYFARLSILILAVSLFKKQNTTVNPIKIENASSIVTSGVFKYSRNPMYLGMALILSGLAGWSSVYCVFEESVVIAGNKLVCRLRSTEYRKLRFLGINQD